MILRPSTRNRDHVNPRRNLTFAHCARLIESYTRGDMSEIMWAFGAPFTGVECAVGALARNDAREISELFQRSIDREILRRNFPGQPALAWFTLANEDTEDLDKYTQRIAALATAGYTADPAEVSETLGLTLTHQPAQPPMGPFGNRAPALLANDDYTRDTNGKFSETQGGGAAKQDPDPPTSTTSDTPDFSQPASLTSDQAADYLSKNPNSPHARAMSLWAEDAEPYSRMISANDSISADWRAKCAETINSVKPDTSGATVNRGWQFKRKEQRDHVLNQVLSEKGFENTRPGMSASYDSKVS